MTREAIAEVLENIATLLELKGENHFKTRAYRNGAEIVSGFSGDIVQLAKDDELKGVKGIGAVECLATFRRESVSIRVSSPDSHVDIDVHVLFESY